MALKANHKAVAELLISNGANVNVKGGDEKTPLHLACHEGLTLVAELLISNGANINVRDRDYRTPLDLCTSNKIREYLQSAADAYECRPVLR